MQKWELKQTNFHHGCRIQTNAKDFLKSIFLITIYLIIENYFLFSMQLDCEDIQSNKLTSPVDINFSAHF